jgi:hypothetical protein
VLTEPLESGRNWVEDPEGNFRAEPGVNESRWLRDDDDRAVTAIFKSLAANAPREALYSLAMERVFYVIASELGLPVPPTYLERFDGAWGSLQIRVVHGLTWRAAPSCPMLVADFANRSSWPLCVALDLMTANYDRHARNILVQPVPIDKAPARAVRSMIWLVDNGHCGLWWPSKFNPALDPSQVEQVDPGNGRMRPEMEARLRDFMPDDYRSSFQGLDRRARQPVLESVRQISDDLLVSALHEIPRRYLSTQARDRTVALFQLRRDEIDNLAADVFPP